MGSVVFRVFMILKVIQRFSFVYVYFCLAIVKLAVIEGKEIGLLEVLTGESEN